MKKVSWFVVINIVVIIVINILESVLSKIAGIEFIYKYSNMILFIFFIIIPLYLIIMENIFLSRGNTKLFLSNWRFNFLIIFISNFFAYLIDRFVIDKIFHIMPDLDNLIRFIVFTIGQVFVSEILILFNIVFLKIKEKLKSLLILEGIKHE